MVGLLGFGHYDFTRDDARALDDEDAFTAVPPCLPPELPDDGGSVDRLLLLGDNGPFRLVLLRPEGRFFQKLRGDRPVNAYGS
jgi:hypothetical protein